MASGRPTGLLGRVLVAGVAGLPSVELDLGPLTALVGPRGSGKSQLLSAIAWLMAGRPRIVPAVDAPATRVAGELRVDGQVAFIAHTPEVEVGGKSNLPLAARLPRQLEIPLVIVFDADRGAASAALDAEIRRAAGPAPVIRLAPDFEAAAGHPAARHRPSRSRPPCRAS